MSSVDHRFAGSIPDVYQTYLVPLIFEAYAWDLASRVTVGAGGRVLEIAAGTGVATRALAATMTPNVALIATDLNEEMLRQASKRGTARPIEWRQADAMQLPFEDHHFDAVVCQFGVMFFPDKVGAFAEVRRVLTPGGMFLFNVWDRLEENEIPHVVTIALESVFPVEPPRFMARVPHGYHDCHAIRRDLAAAGFNARAQIDTVAARSRAASAWDAAVAFCQGTPLRSEIEARDASALSRATHAAAQAVEARFGRGSVNAAIKAHVITARRD
jgi:SAM-dependent methyltransferase